MSAISLPPRQPSLCNLPCEIQLLICTHLCIHCSGGTQAFDRWAGDDDNQQTLLALSQTSRLFHHLAQPVAFHRFQYVPSEWQSNAFVKFVRTLVKRPDLAGHVKELCQHHYEVGNWRSEHDFEMLKVTARHLGMDSEEDGEFESALEQDVSPYKFCMELLIALLPNLEALHLLVEDKGTEKTTYTYLRRRLKKLGSGGTLKRLRRLIIDTDSNWGAYFTNPVVGVMHQVAPHLEELVLRRNMGFKSMDMAHRNLGIMFSGTTQYIRTLNLHRCALSNDPLSTSFLDLLVKHAPRLERFSYRSQESFFGETLGTHLMPGEIVKCLMPVSGTLKSINIDLTEHWNHDPGSLLTGTAMAMFEYLEDLELDESAFCRHYNNPETRNTIGHNCLTGLIPPTVKVLTVRLYEVSCVWPDLAELASSSAQFPSLKKVIVHALWGLRNEVEPEEFEEEVRSEGDKLRDLVAETHLELEILQRQCDIPDVMRYEWQDGVIRRLS
ncbi:hypothetical protein ACHAPT_002197 [Fusarium lateritium]